jgi:hypothetical protein
LHPSFPFRAFENLRQFLGMRTVSFGNVPPVFQLLGSYIRSGMLSTIQAGSWFKLSISLPRGLWKESWSVVLSLLSTSFFPFSAVFSVLSGQSNLVL